MPMAKPEEKKLARKMRRGGQSIKDISNTLSVSPSTVSVWCEDISLNTKQRGALLTSKMERIRLGQLKGAEIQRQKRLDKIHTFQLMAEKNLRVLTKREFYMAGLALYLAEGSKKDRSTMIVNSDPRVISFMIRWFGMFNIPKNRLIVSVLVNVVHKNRETQIIEFWSSFLAIKKEQFRKTIFVRTKQKKHYENSDKYYGTLRLKVSKGTDLSYEINAFASRLLVAPLNK